LSRAAIVAWRNSTRSGTGSSGCGLNEMPPPRSVLTASQSRYAAPASLIASKANGIASSTTVMPSAASSTCTITPAATPSSEKYPARRPWVSVRDSR